MIAIDIQHDCTAKTYVESNQNLRDNIRFYETGEDIIDLQLGSGDIGFFDHNQGFKYDGLHDLPEKTVVVLVEGLHWITPHLDEIPRDKRYIFMTSNSWNVDDYQWPFEYTIVECNFHFWDRLFTHFNLYNFNFFTPLHYDFDCAKPYHFYAPVGQKHRAYRSLIVNKLQSVNYDNFILRFHGQNLGANNYDRLSIESTRDDQHFNAWQGLPGYEKHYVTLSEMIPLRTMNQCRLVVPVETQIEYSSSFFYTEKTIKCLITGAPFVCYSNQYHMKNLREQLGFETYHSLWDESYDSIQDPEQRAQAIVDLLDRLRDFDWESARPELLRIKHHNMYNVFNLRDRERRVFIQNSKRIKEFLGRE